MQDVKRKKYQTRRIHAKQTQSCTRPTGAS